MVLTAQEVFLRLGDRTVLDGVSIALPQASVTALLGCNGAGKSSLLKLLSGDLRPCAGRVQLGGTDISSFSDRQLAQRRAVLQQNPRLAFSFATHQVISMGMSRHTSSRREQRALLSMLLELTGLSQLAGHDYTRLSGGEQQRVHLARVLAQLWPCHTQHAPVLLLDEPVSALDLAWQQRVLEILQWLAHEQSWTVLMVLHDMNQAASYADNVHLLHRGKCLCSGSPSEVLRSEHLHTAFNVNAHVQPHPKFERRPHVVPLAADFLPISAIVSNTGSAAVKTAR